MHGIRTKEFENLLMAPKMTFQQSLIKFQDMLYHTLPESYKKLLLRLILLLRMPTANKKHLNCLTVAISL